MKKIAFFLVSIVLFGCSNDSDSNSDAEVACGSVSLLSVVQDFDNFAISWESQGSFDYFEIAHTLTSSIGNGIPSNFNESFTTTNESFYLLTMNSEWVNSIAQDNETLSFFIKGKCVNGQSTNWEGPFVINVEEFCEKPFDLNFHEVYNEFQWDYDDWDSSPSYYQVEYGLQNFELGSGTQFTTNNKYVSDVSMAGGSFYDFYVRAYCDNSLGWSDWSEYNFYAEHNYNLCTQPSNLEYYVEYISGGLAGVRFEWDYNGETQFEYVLNEGAVHTIDNASGWPVFTGLSTSITHTFYVRAVCSDGTRTFWAGPLEVDL